MATYKVIQDIEAEDKLLGPLTLRQFIYAGITAVCLYMSFLVVTRGAPFLIIVFLPVALLCGFFAFPWKQDQPTEVWALAKVRFFFKPHKRIWNQSGIKELVTITAPKKVVVDYTDGLSQSQVKSRLKALADTIDTRGWAIKNANVNLYSHPQAEAQQEANSDRLVDPSGLPQDVPAIDVQAADDILDEKSNPIAQHFDQMITAATATHRQQITQTLRNQANAAAGNQSPTGNAPADQNQAQNDYWFMSQPGQQSATPSGYVTFNPAVVTPVDNYYEPAAETAEEQALAKKLHELHEQQTKPYSGYSNLHTIQPLSERATAKTTSAKTANAPVTPTLNPAIVELASDNDKDVATLARLANQKKPANSSPDEVVISLH